MKILKSKLTDLVTGQLEYLANCKDWVTGLLDLISGMGVGDRISEFVKLEITGNTLKYIEFEDYPDDQNNLCSQFRYYSDHCWGNQPLASTDFIRFS